MNFMQYSDILKIAEEQKPLLLLLLSPANNVLSNFESVKAVHNSVF